MKLKRVCVRLAFAIIVGLVALAAWNYWPTESGTLDDADADELAKSEGELAGLVTRPGGTEEWLRQLDDELAAGVTPMNNALIPLMKALGPDLLFLPNQSERDATLERLGVTRDELAAGPGFIPWDQRQRVLAPATAAANATSRPELPEVLAEARVGRMHQDVVPWLEANKPALALVKQAAQRPKFWVPGSAGMPFPLTSAMPVANALTLRAATRHARGDLEGAWQDAMTLHGLARHIQKVPLPGYQRSAFAIERRAAEAGLALATDPALDAKVAKQALDQLRQMQPAGEVGKVVDTTMRAAALAAVARMSRGDPLDSCELCAEVFGPVLIESLVTLASVDVDWLDVAKRVNQGLDQLVSHVNKARYQPRKSLRWASLRIDEYDQLTAMAAGRLGQDKRNEIVADTILGLALLEIPSDHQATVRMQFQIEKLALALAVFKADSGRYPAQLADLVPKYLAAVPDDPFSGRGLVYRRAANGYLLYSVGADQQDDGGHAEDDIVATVK
jgi:hypothetical protein